MKVVDALNILGCEPGTVTLDIVKLAYRRACKKYHPDVNPAGTEIMKMVNTAWSRLKEFFEVELPNQGRDSMDYEPSKKGGSAGYGEAIAEALAAIIHLPGIEIEVCGSWVWVGGNTKPVRAEIKAAGFKWAQAKGKWYYRPEGQRSRSRGGFTMNEIREHYGSSAVETEERDAVRAA